MYGGVAIGASYAGVTAAPTNGAIIQGNVGIGTATPAGPLDVEGGLSVYNTAALPIKIIGQTGNNSVGGSVVIMSGSSTSGTTSAGYIGIGTTSPTSIVDIEGGASAWNQTGLVIKIIGQTGSNTVGGGVIIMPGSSTSGTTSAGYIGVGTTSPTGAVDIEGGQAAYNQASVPVKIIGQTGNTNNGSGGHIIIQPGAGVGAGSAGGVAMGTYTTGPSNGLAVSGNVGIGTTTPQSKLDVSGGVSIGTGYAGVTAAPTNGAIIQGNVGIGTTAPRSGVILDLGSNTNSMLLPIGTTNQRPTGIAGMIRYNSQVPQVEAYYNSTWNALGNVCGTTTATYSSPWSGYIVVPPGCAVTFKTWGGGGGGGTSINMGYYGGAGGGGGAATITIAAQSSFTVYFLQAGGGGGGGTTAAAGSGGTGSYATGGNGSYSTVGGGDGAAASGVWLGGPNGTPEIVAGGGGGGCSASSGCSPGASGNSGGNTTVNGAAGSGNGGAGGGGGYTTGGTGGGAGTSGKGGSNYAAAGGSTFAGSNQTVGNNGDGNKPANAGAGGANASAGSGTAGNDGAIYYSY